MHYWIDGYNLFFRLAKTHKNLKKHEKDLLESLYQAMLWLHAPLTVVFDGREAAPAVPLRRNLLAMNIVYTPIHQTADNYILEMIDNSQNPADQMVVSSDRELLVKARQKGAHIQSVEEFIHALTSKKGKAAPEKKQVKETSSQFIRLLEIFQKKLEEDE